MSNLQDLEHLDGVEVNYAIFSSTGQIVTDRNQSAYSTDLGELWAASLTYIYYATLAEGCVDLGIDSRPGLGVVRISTENGIKLTAADLGEWFAHG